MICCGLRVKMTNNQLLRYPLAFLIDGKVKPLLRGHPDERPPPLERPLDNVNLNINVLIYTPDARPPLLKGHFSGAKRVASQEGFHCKSNGYTPGVKRSLVLMPGTSWISGRTSIYFHPMSGGQVKISMLVNFSLTRTSYLVTGQVKILMDLPGGQVKIFRFFYPCTLITVHEVNHGFSLPLNWEWAWWMDTIDLGSQDCLWYCECGNFIGNIWYKKSVNKWDFIIVEVHILTLNW